MGHGGRRESLPFPQNSGIQGFEQRIDEYFNQFKTNKTNNSLFTQ